MTSRSLSLKSFIGVVEHVPPKLERAVLRGLRSAALRGKGFVVEEISTARPHPAVDRGTMRNSVVVRSRPKGALVTVDAPHAPVMEDGARPFFPPLAPLAAWAKRKGLAQSDKEAQGVAFAIAKAMSKRGIEPRHFFAKGMERMYKIVAGEIQAELDQLK